MESDTESATPYPVGTKARKVGGTYQADVTVVAVGVTSTGAVRYLCEFDELPGMLHVFNGGQLEVREEQTVTTTTTQGQGEPIELEKVLPGDVVLVVRTYANGYEQTARGVVLCTHDDHVRLALPTNTYASWRIYSGADYTTRLFLLHRPPRRREISKDDLILKTPIGTRVVLEFPDELGQKAGVFQSICRSDEGWVVRMGGTPFEMLYVVKLSDIKAIYTEEVQG